MNESIIEFFAVVFSILSVVLATKKNIHNWTIGLLGIFGYMYIFWVHDLYANFFLQLIFIAQSIQGYFLWNKIEAKKEITISRLICTLFYSTLFLIMSIYFEVYTNNPLPILDSLATTLSILATYLLIHKKHSTWLFWILADIVYVIIFANQNLILSSLLYVVFLCIAIFGYFKWKQNEA